MISRLQTPIFAGLFWRSCGTVDGWYNPVVSTIWDGFNTLRWKSHENRNDAGICPLRVAFFCISGLCGTQSCRIIQENRRMESIKLLKWLLFPGVINAQSGVSQLWKLGRLQTKRFTARVSLRVSSTFSVLVCLTIYLLLLTCSYIFLHVCSAYCLLQKTWL